MIVHDHRSLIYPLSYLMFCVLVSSISTSLSQCGWGVSVLVSALAVQQPCRAMDRSSWQLWVASNGALYTSTNQGQTWQLQSNALNVTWTSIQMSADGTMMVATDAAGLVYTSTTGGSSWGSSTGLPGINQGALLDTATSSSGSVLITAQEVRIRIA